jgi:hypothetical protein
MQNTSERGESNIYYRFRKSFPEYEWAFDMSSSHRKLLTNCGWAWGHEKPPSEGHRVVLIEAHDHPHRTYIKSNDLLRDAVFPTVQPYNTFVKIRFDPWSLEVEELLNAVRNVLDPTFTLPSKQPDRPMITCDLFYENPRFTPEDKHVFDLLTANWAIGKRKRGVAS